LWVGFSTTFLSSFDTELGSKDLIDAIDNDVPLKEIIIRRWSCIPSTNIFSLPTEDMIEFFQYIRSKNEKINLAFFEATLRNMQSLHPQKENWNIDAYQFLVIECTFLW
jgi:hypothetical protein